MILVYIDMAPRVGMGLFKEHHEVFDIIFENLARRSTRAQKETFYASISVAMFPGLMRRHQWEIVDRTSLALARREFYQVHISITENATLWFMNLRMLQIRVKLGLIDYYYQKPGFATIRIFEVMCKFRALAQIVGEERLFNHYRPPLRLPRVIRTFPIRPVRLALRRQL